MFAGKAGYDIRIVPPIASNSYFMSEQKKIPEIIRLDAHHHQPLRAGGIHLYVMSVNEMQHDEAELASYLNPDEEVRASRFINPEHGRKYRCVRGMLRKLLSHYLNMAPGEIEFCYAEHGKPSLKGGSSLHFNLSHSRDMAAYAFSRDHELGVDIEYMRPQKDLAGMMRHVGSSKEQAEILGLSEDDAYEAFYWLWTRKEAFIKACGRGLGMGLRSIHIGTRESDSPISVEYKNERLPEWFVQDINPPKIYKLALCSKFLNG